MSKRDMSVRQMFAETGFVKDDIWRAVDLYRDEILFELRADAIFVSKGEGTREWPGMKLHGIVVAGFRLLVGLETSG